MIKDRVQISPGYGIEGVSADTMEGVLDRLWESHRFQDLLETQRQKPECEESCNLTRQFETTLGGFSAEITACRKCRQIVVNLSRIAAA